MWVYVVKLPVIVNETTSRDFCRGVLIGENQFQP